MVRQVTTSEREFPGALTAWYGQFTKTWWALVPVNRGPLRLVEAHSPKELREAIANAATWPWPRAHWSVR